MIKSIDLLTELTESPNQEAFDMFGVEKVGTWGSISWNLHINVIENSWINVVGVHSL